MEGALTPGEFRDLVSSASEAIRSAQALIESQSKYIKTLKEENSKLNALLEKAIALNKEMLSKTALAASVGIK